MSSFSQTSQFARWNERQIFVAAAGQDHILLSILDLVPDFCEMLPGVTVSC